jgi:hypothetical protein
VVREEQSAPLEHRSAATDDQEVPLETRDVATDDHDAAFEGANVPTERFARAPENFPALIVAVFR